MKKLPEQECLGSFSPVLRNCVVKDSGGPVFIGRVRRLRSTGLPAHMFANFECTLRAIKKNGTKIKKVVNLEMLR